MAAAAAPFGAGPSPFSPAPPADLAPFTLGGRPVVEAVVEGEAEEVAAAPLLAPAAVVVRVVPGLLVGAAMVGAGVGGGVGGGVDGGRVVVISVVAATHLHPAVPQLAGAQKKAALPPEKVPD